MKAIANHLIDTITKNGAKVMSVTDIKKLIQITELEFKCNKNSMINLQKLKEKINNFKDGFALAPTEWPQETIFP